MKAYERFRRIIIGSKAYEFNGEELEITGYYTGERITIDFGTIDEDLFEQLVEAGVFPEEEGDEE